MQNKFTIEDVIKFWDKVANIYEKSHKKIKDTHFQRFSEAIKYLDLKPDLKILNIWSRTGEAIPFIRNKCKDVELFNLEASPGFIEIASKNFPDEKFEQTDLNSLPFKDEYLGYILSLETLEHTPNPLRFLKECYRVLKPNGILVMSCPPATMEIPSKIYKILFKDHGEGPHKFLSSRRVKKLISGAGFELISHKGTLLVPIGPKFLRAFGEKIINKLQKTIIKEFGIRQFYICKK